MKMALHKKDTSESMMTKKSKNLTEDQRKVQMTGGSTYILSLPKDWAVKNELKQGSIMVVREEDDGSLSVIPSSFPKKEKQEEALIRASESDNPDAIMRTAISAYLNGFNIIRINPPHQKVLSFKLRNLLKGFARNYFVGTEIIIDTPNELALQVLLNYPELTVQNALSRMSIIAASMHKESITSLKKLDYASARSVIETDREVNRFSLYVVRLLKLAVSNPRIVKEIGLNDQRECLGYRLIVKSVERTADHATKIAEDTLLLREIISESLANSITQLSELATKMFENSIEALFKNDFNLAESVIERLSLARKLEKETVLNAQSARPEEIANLRLIIESIRRTAEYASDISEVVLNLNVESVLC